MFESHLLSMLLFAAIVSVLLAFLRHDDAKLIRRAALRTFVSMVGGVLLFSWVMRFL